MSLLSVVFRILDKAGASFIEPRREDGHGSAALTPTYVVGGNMFSTLNSTNTPLAGNATYTGTFEDLNGYVSVSVLVNTDSAATNDALKLDFSTDGTNVDRTVMVDILPGGDYITVGGEAKFFRVRMTAGSSAQTYMRLQTHYSAIPEGPKMTPLVDTLTDSSSATLTRSVIVGKTTAGGGGYVPVKVNPSGALTVDATGLVGVKGADASNIATTANRFPVNTELSAEREYTPGLRPFLVTASGDTTVFTPTAGKAWILHWAYAVPVTRGSEDAPVITIKTVNAANALIANHFIATAVSKSKRITMPADARLVVNLDLAVRTPCTFDIEELP